MRTVMDTVKTSRPRSLDKRNMAYAVQKTKLSDMILFHSASFVGQARVGDKNYAFLSQYTHKPPEFKGHEQYYFHVAMKEYDLQEKELFVQVENINSQPPSNLSTVFIAIEAADIPTLISKKKIEVKNPDIGKCLAKPENHYINKSHCIAVDINQQPLNIKSDEVKGINENNGERLAEFYDQNRPLGSFMEYHYNAKKNEFEIREIKIPPIDSSDL